MKIRKQEVKLREYVFYSVAVGVSVASIVLSNLGLLPTEKIVPLLGIGILSVALGALTSLGRNE